jgi:hypothetical protein
VREGKEMDIETRVQLIQHYLQKIRDRIAGGWPAEEALVVRMEIKEFADKALAQIDLIL